MRANTTRAIHSEMSVAPTALLQKQDDSQHDSAIEEFCWHRHWPRFSFPTQIAQSAGSKASWGRAAGSGATEQYTFNFKSSKEQLCQKQAP